MSSINNYMIWEKIKNRYYRSPKPIIFEGELTLQSILPESPWWDRTIRWVNILKDLAALIFSTLSILRFFGKV